MMFQNLRLELSHTQRSGARPVRELDPFPPFSPASHRRQKRTDASRRASTETDHGAEGRKGARSMAASCAVPPLLNVRLRSICDARAKIPPEPEVASSAVKALVT